MVEVKDPDKPVRFTPAQKKFQADFVGPYIVAQSGQEADAELYIAWKGLE